MKPKTKIPTLGSVAQAKDDEKTKAKAAGVLASLASLLGLGGDDKPGAKMSKKTEVTKHTITEESDTDSGEEEEEEETSSTMDTEGTEDSSAAEEEEEEEEEEEAAAEEEEEEASAKGLGRALRAAYKHPSVKAAFLAALPKEHRAAASLRSPDRLFREVRKATGARTLDGAMTALSRQRSKAAAGDAKVIKALAKTDAKVAELAASQRAERVEAIVKQAKAEGRAPSKDLRAQLRAYGNEHGTKKLTALVAALRPVRTDERVPGADAKGNPVGAPTVESQMSEMAMADLSPEAREQYAKIRAAVAASRNPNGATPKGGF